MGDPAQISSDEKGLLRHRDGRAVAYAPHGPRTRSVDPDKARRPARSVGQEDADGERLTVDAGASPARRRDMQPGAAQPYKTR